MAGEEVLRIMVCGYIQLPRTDLASVAYRLESYSILNFIRGALVRKCKWV